MVVPVAWKLSTVEAWCQDQSCLSQQGNCRNKGQKDETLLGSSPGEDSFCRIEAMHNRRQKLFVSKRKLRKPRPQKTVLGYSTGKDVFLAQNKNNRRLAPK
jgi:hypothetical protein